LFIRILYFIYIMAKLSRKERAAQQNQPEASVVTAKVAPRSTESAVKVPRGTAEMPFSKQNYVWLGICFATIVLAYTLMRIENAEDGFLALYVCPILLAAGYLGVFYALFKR
jgi:hypothetical protein